LTNEVFPCIVIRVSLPGEDELQGAVRIIDQARQALHIFEDERRALVSGEAAGKTNGEQLRVEHLGAFPDLQGRRSPPQELASETVPRKRDQLFPSSLMGPPELLVWNLIDSLPNPFRLGIILPVRAQVAVVQLRHLLGNP